MLHKVSWLLLPLLFFSPLVWGSDKKNTMDETMLMFVGEELSALTVASRRPESPAAAPAIARVADRSDMENRGFQTLSELLSTEPGFFMANRASGTVPYLRGIPDGILFLYDGVPMTTDVTKNLYPLDRELSLHSVKRVEIVSGPGSVLWGPDAFAGIVNVVPFTGRDRPGYETKVFAGSEDLQGGYFSWGDSGRNWDAFVSGYGARDRYHDDTFIVEKSFGTSGQEPPGEGHIDDSYYYELTGNAHIGDWFSLSGRLSDFKYRYTMKDIGVLSWEGERESPVSYLKANLNKTIGASHLSFTGYYEGTRYEVTDVDVKREQKNRIYYGELLWDLRIWQKGLLTAGVSYRENNVDGALVKDGFLPDFLKPGTVFVPSIEQQDYRNNLKSVFAQYRHQWRDMDWWIGGRIDNHSQYRSTTTYSLGINWSLIEDWRIKAVYGTAYRSPYSSQLFGGTAFEPEGISTFNFQAAWNPDRDRTVALTAFYSRLTDHIQEDPYGGLSSPSKQRVFGIELTGRAKVLDSLDIFAGLTALNDSDGSEQYRAFKYAFIRPDGSLEKYYDTWEEPFDTGPDFMARMGFIWRFHPKATLALDGGITGSVPYTFAKDTVSGRFSQPLLIDLTLKVKDLFVKNALLTLRGKNILNQDYEVPGLYGPVEGEPFAFYLEWGYRF